MPKPIVWQLALGATMSALGHKRTFAVQNGMSALPPKADMCGATRDVRFVPIADIPAGATQRLSCPGSCARWRAFTPCSKSVPKWSRIPLLNHPTVTRGPRCRYLFSHKAGTDTRQHVMANHVNPRARRSGSLLVQSAFVLAHQRQ
jgi:hypothetical protein